MNSASVSSFPFERNFFLQPALPTNFFETSPDEANVKEALDFLSSTIFMARTNFSSAPL